MTPNQILILKILACFAFGYFVVPYLVEIVWDLFSEPVAIP